MKSLLVGSLFVAALLGLLCVQWLYWPLYVVLISGSGVVVLRL